LLRKYQLFIFNWSLKWSQGDLVWVPASCES